MGGDGGNISIIRLPFGWKYSPVLCQRVLQFFIKDLKIGQVVVLHYLDDFMVLGKDFAKVSEVTDALVATLIDKGFLISPKSTLIPTQDLAWLGKQFDLLHGRITNSDGALAIGVAKWLKLATGHCTRKRVQRVVGKFRWLARPHDYISPLLAGPIAHTLWGPGYLPHTPLAILRSLGSVLALAATGWSPVPRTPVGVWFWDTTFFVDAARQYKSFCWGLFCDRIGVRFGWCKNEIRTQCCAELVALCEGVRVAVHRGWKHLNLVGDNTSALAQAVRIKGGVGLISQQRVLRQISYMLARSELKVWLFWVPTAFMPADPISRYLEDFGADMGKAETKAREIYQNLKTSYNVLVDYGRINGDISPEQRQAKKEEDRRVWLESMGHTAPH